MRIVFRSAAQRAKLQSAPLPSSYIVTVDIFDLPPDERQHQIRHVFESSLGSHVSEATLAKCSVHIVLHVAAHQMKTVHAQLGKLVPKAVIRDIRPREADFLHNRATS